MCCKAFKSFSMSAFFITSKQANVAIGCISKNLKFMCIGNIKSSTDLPSKKSLVSLNDSSGIGVLGDTEKLRKITNKVYSIKSRSDQKLDLGFSSLNCPELDSIIIMSKFYPWIIKYSMYKGLDPDTPRYLTKVTQTY